MGSLKDQLRKFFVDPLAIRWFCQARAHRNGSLSDARQCEIGEGKLGSCGFVFDVFLHFEDHLVESRRNPESGIHNNGRDAGRHPLPMHDWICGAKHIADCLCSFMIKRVLSFQSLEGGRRANSTFARCQVTGKQLKSRSNRMAGCYQRQLWVVPRM